MHKLLSKKLMLVAIFMAILIIAAIVVPAYAVGTNVLTVHGSTSLGPTFEAQAALFNAAGKGVTVSLPTTQNSSGAGIGDLLASPQLCDVAMASRPLKSTESAATQIAVMKDAVIVMVNDTNTPASITYLSKKMIRGIYEGVYKEADGKQYWDADATTTPALGLTGDDSVKYELGVAYPALPGHGIAGAHVQIVVQARNMESGTRGFLGDSTGNGGCAFAKNSGIPGIYTYATWFPLEQALIGSDDTNRQSSGSAMANAVNTNALGASIGYAGLANIKDASHPNIRELALVDDMTGTDTAQYRATVLDGFMQVYSGHYHLARNLYLDTRNGDANAANVKVLTDWMVELDGAAQDQAVTSHELRINPDADINHDNSINFLDLGLLGTAYGTSGTANSHWNRSDINHDGNVNYLDLGTLGNWYGVSVVALP